MNKMIALLLGLSLSLAGTAQSIKMYNASTKEEVALEKMALELANADVVFVGEQHDDSLTHVFQAQLFKALASVRENRLALSLDMFETDCQEVLNEYLAGLINEDRLIREGRAWGNYKDYRPLVEFAKEQQLRVIAANAPRRYVNLVARRGMKSLDSLSAVAKKWLPPLPYDTLSGPYYEKFSALMGGHGSSNIYYSQSLWDASMSYSIYRYRKQHKKELVYHLCGSFHSDNWLGTVAQLRKRNRKLTIKTVSCIPFSRPEAQDRDSWAQLADYVVLTTATVVNP